MKVVLATALVVGVFIIAMPVYAVQGDPIPGIDVSIEQDSGGIIIASHQTDGSGIVTFHEKAGPYTIVVGKIPGSKSKSGTATVTITPQNQESISKVVPVSAQESKSRNATEVRLAGQGLQTITIAIAYSAVGRMVKPKSTLTPPRYL